MRKRKLVRRVIEMKRAFAAWMWSLAVVARSYWTVLALAALIALWNWAAYEWLGLPESSLWLLILAVLWAVVQLLAVVVIMGGCISGATEVAATDGVKLPIRALWLKDRPKLLNTIAVCLGSLIAVLLWQAVFAWINNHSIEVASYLTFHVEKPVSHVIIERIFVVIEGLLWIALSGFLLSFLITLLRNGWAGTLKQIWKLLAGCLYRTQFLTSLLSVVVFSGAAYLLVNWHPRVSVGFWDYTQVVTRFSLALVLRVAGGLFWVLSLARLYFPKQDPPQA
jgi:hypothetical protein